MNYVFNSNSNMANCSKFFESEYKIEYLHVEDDVVESPNNVMNEFDCCKQSPCDFPSVNDENFLNSKSIPINNLEKDDILLSCNLKSTYLFDSNSNNLIDSKKTETVRELDLYKMNHKVEKIGDKYDEKPNLADKGLQKSENVKELQQNSETLSLTKKNLTASLNQSESHNEDSTTSSINKNVCRKRWGRTEDILAFNKLQKMCNQENIVIETFWSQDSALSDKHYSLLSELIQKLNWKRNTQAMLKRIISLGKNQEMSVRQMKLFRRLNKEAQKQNKPLDVKKIAYMFPGKLISTLQRCIRRY